MKAGMNELAEFAERINPAKLGYHKFLAAIVGAIIGFDYGVLSRKDGRLTNLSITSDGFVMADSTAHETGAFIGSADEMVCNLEVWLKELTPDDRAKFKTLYERNVTDWRNI